jgi:2-keto-3-deoxy-6-phosphogluconate aldolase
MAEFFDAGACGFGVASDIANRRLIDAGDFAAIEARARRYTEQIKKF